jgi:hypothetical protein
MNPLLSRNEINSESIFQLINSSDKVSAVGNSRKSVFD